MMSSQQRSTRSHPILVTTKGNPDNLLRHPKMMNRTSYQTARLPQEPLKGEAETLALRIADFERSNHVEVDEHVEDELIYNGVMETFVLPEEQSVRTNEDYMTRSEVEMLVDDNVETFIEVAPRRVATGIVEERIEDGFVARYNAQKKRSRHQSEIWWKTR